MPACVGGRGFVRRSPLLREVLCDVPPTRQPANPRAPCVFADLGHVRTCLSHASVAQSGAEARPPGIFAVFIPYS